MKLHLLLPTLLLTSSLLGAQAVTFRGQVEDVQGTANQFFVDCTNVQLVSPTINLTPLIGQQTEISGTWNGSVTMPSVTVSAIQVVTENFGLGGGGKIGEDLSLDILGPVGRPAVIYSSLGSSFFPLSGAGAVMLDLTIARPVASGIIPGGGNLQFKVTVPNDPALIGTTVFAQGGILVSPGSLLLTNSDCKTLRN